MGFLVACGEKIMGFVALFVVFWELLPIPAEKSLHVLPVSGCDLSGYSGFLPSPRHVD